jgi:uncharacterized membrane protein YfcA
MIEFPVICERIGEWERWKIAGTGRSIGPEGMSASASTQRAVRFRREPLRLNQIVGPIKSKVVNLPAKLWLSLLVTLLIGTGAVILLSEAAIHVFRGPSAADLGAVFVASTLSSIAGFAFSAICGAFLFHLISKPVHVVQIMIVCSIAIQMFSVATLRNTIDWRHLARFVLGGTLGLPVGVYMLTHITSSLYLRCMGGFLIAYGLYMLFRRSPSAIPSNRLGDYAAGFLGGVTGGFAGFPGAFVTIWCGLKGWSKDRQRGVYQPFILIMQIMALALIEIGGRSSAGAGALDFLTLSYVPGALLGTWCGIAIFRKLTDLQFARLVNLLLIVSGVGLLS